ncbi:MAG: hypothetical protein M4579_002353 [Chaenotheca gracillima]|nr:MAG: hypothetical protein M4579_002353 [Chaenotheca gracillima]
MTSETTPLCQHEPDMKQSDGSAAEKQEENDKKSNLSKVRRKRVSTLFAVGIFTWIVWLAALFTLSGDDSSFYTIEDRVNMILSETPLIDGHNDLAIFIRFMYDSHIYSRNFSAPFENGSLPMHVDIPRLREGKSGGAFWSAFVPCPKDGSNFSAGNYVEAIRETQQQIDLLQRLTAAYPSTFSSQPRTTADALVSFHLHHQLISPLAIEGLHQIGLFPSLLRLYHKLGVRYATLTHNCHNIYADAALLEDHSPGGQGAVFPAPPRWGGINPGPGRALITEMNRMGMIVDLSHVSHATMLDVLAGEHTSPESSNVEHATWPGSAAPIIFSHSSAYALCPHPRNVPDHILHQVARTSSLVMVNFSPDFISCTAAQSDSISIKPNSTLPTPDPAHATLDRVVEHILHIAKVTGSFDHVGLGSDFDGIFSVPSGLEDVSKFPKLVAELLRRGVSDEDAGKVVGGNLLRVWKAVEDVAKEMQGRGLLPMEDDAVVSSESI